MSKVVVVRTGNEEYAISLQSVVSIEKLEGITPIPQAPEYVMGMIEKRQQVIPVVDLEYIFYRHFSKADENSRLVVVQSKEFSIGILVTEAKEIIDIPAENIKQLGFIASPATAYILGVASLNGCLVTIIDTDVLIGSLEGINDLLTELESHL